MKTYTVGKSGFDYERISDAIADAQGTNQDVLIKIMPGTYNERIEIFRDNIHLQGSGSDKTIITNGVYAKMIHPDGKNYGTFRTATVKVEADGFRADNLSIINTSGNGKEYGQAVALSVDGDKAYIENCRLIARQDTLFAGPHPSSTEVKRQLYRKCYIEGDIDFIFGGAKALFSECEIFSRYGTIEDEAKLPEEEVGGEIAGYITAACTHEGADYGFVFDSCRLTGDCPDNTVFLGRPWRNFAKTVFINCQYGPHIRKEGWYDWGKKEARSTVLYGEYAKDQDMHERVDWANIMNEDEAKKILEDMKIETDFT